MRFLPLVVMLACTGASDPEDTAGSGDTGVDGEFPQVSGGDSDTAQFLLAFDALRDEDGDGRWEIGERAFLDVAMTNVGADDFDYPQCTLTSEDLASGQGDSPFFGLAANDTNTCVWTLQPLESAVAFDVVAVEVIASRLGCADQGDCPEENPLSLRFLLEPPN